jgi:DNA-binding NarL/FixJ family response regulator
MKRTTIALADDHKLFTESLEKLIFIQPAYEHSFSEHDGEAMLRLLAEKQPDILILDINFPPFNGIQLIPAVRSVSPETKILLLSMHQPADFSLTPENFPADGYMLKTSGKDVLMEALATLAASAEPYFCPEIQWSQAEPVKDGPGTVLTRREKDIIRLISEGKTSRDIADALDISENTVKTHRARIREKMNVTGVAELLNKIYSVPGSAS